MDANTQALLDQENEANKKKALIRSLGAVGDSMSNGQSVGNFYLGQMNPTLSGSSKVADAQADAVADPMSQQAKAFEYLKAKRANADAVDDDVYKQSLKNPQSKQSMAMKAMAAKFGVPVDPNASGADYLHLFDPKKMNEEQIKGEVERKNKIAEIMAGKNADMAKMKAEKDLQGTPAEKAVDTDFAKDYANWYAGGGKSSVQKNISQMQSAVNDLKNSKDMTGGLSMSIPGMSSDAVQKKLNPEMIIARDKIRGAIQNTLKETLGAQFTEAEGERIMNRAFDPQLTPAENARRAQVELDGLKSRAQAKEDAAKYYEKNRTLRGYKPATSDTGMSGDKQVVKTERNKKTGEARLTYADGSTEIKPSMAGN